MSVVPAGCCCDGVYIAFPCWENRTLLFEINTVNPFTRTFIANGSSANSNNPPAGTLAKLVLIGAGGAGNGLESGGGGAYVETQVTLAATTMTFRTGHGGAVTDVGATVFGGGSQGATRTRYGGGASAFNLNASTNFMAAGGGAAASSNYTAQTTQTSRGGDGGISSSLRPSTDVSTASGSTTTAGGTGGTTGGGTGSLGTLPSAGTGGLGAALSSGQGGGGGGGGGRAAGGGGGNQTVAGVTHGGAGTGGSSLGGAPALSHSGKNGYAQASPFTNLTTTRGIGDGGLQAGGAARAALAWRACDACPCPEMPAGIPPALHICMTQAQFDAIKAAAGSDPCADTPFPSPYIGFNYQGWPFYIVANPTLIAPPRPCDRVAASGDISGGRWVAFSNYCCQLWRLPRFIGTSPLCTPDCTGQQECPDFIYMCDQYRHDLGLPPCADVLGDNQCYFVQYNGCDYKFTGETVDGDCTTPTPTPLNVGTGLEVGDCTTGKVPSTWTVGPHVFTGGFQCGSQYTVTWDADGYPWCAANVAACRADIGEWSWQFKMDCLVAGTGEDTCYLGLPPCKCGAPWDSNVCSDFAITRPARKRQGLCNTTGDPNVCSNACLCPGWRGEATSTWLDGTPDGTPLPYVPALTITRNCPHPTSTTWLAVDELGGTVTIDGCTFVGNGTAQDFATRINQVLGDRLTAVGSPSYWIGPRWRGSLPYPNDYECNGSWMGGYGSMGDRCQVISNTATVGVIACQYSSVWFVRIELGVAALTAFSPGYGACTCTGSPACLAAASYESTYQAERPDQPIVFSSFAPFTLWAASPPFQTCCQPDPYAWVPPATIDFT